MLNDLIFWLFSGGLALVDGFLVVSLYRRISLAKFSQLAIPLTFTTFIFWSALWTIVLWLAWDWFYGFLFPSWVRLAAPALGLVYAPIGLLIWALSRKMGSPVAIFCLFGGLEGIISHTWAIFGLNLIQKIPLMGSATAVPVLVFAFFEKILYWSLILGISARINQRVRNFRKAV